MRETRAALADTAAALGHLSFVKNHSGNQCRGAGALSRPAHRSALAHHHRPYDHHHARLSDNLPAIAASRGVMGFRAAGIFPVDTVPDLETAAGIVRCRCLPECRILG